MRGVEEKGVPGDGEGSERDGTTPTRKRESQLWKIEIIIEIVL